MKRNAGAGDGRPVTSGAWFEGDPIGRRRFFTGGPLPLEAGGLLPEYTLAYETWGTLNEERSNAVLILHALTGDSHLAGEAGPGHPTAGWWTDLIGPGAPIDTEDFFVVAPNILGGCQGSTGPASLRDPGVSPSLRWGSDFPFITIRDTVQAEVQLADALGIEKWAMVVGGSLGGMRALEWAVMYPGRIQRLVPVATTAATTADQIAWAHTQLAAILNDPAFNDGNYYEAPLGEGPRIGLGIARQIAHTTYRSAPELESRFGAEPQGAEDPWSGGRYAVQSYLEHQGAKFVNRFDANSYRVLTEAFMSHDLGRGRGGLSAALSQIEAQTLVIAVDSDRLCLPEASEVIAEEIPSCAGVVTVRSHSGHDGFLIEFDQFGPLLKEFLEGRISDLESSSARPRPTWAGRLRAAAEVWIKNPRSRAN
ncbi:homoserine O-acetyltransferase MetX [Actinomyces minihominis]|uniref:homoserine O-acetyltransferase MetX n=1 Tax=Actinomyces minihominis TaxID=2002838 RepID=UPI000C086A92|nr:homoserine O-acetyltransferase [Actinomyces minihominis]